VIVHTGCALTTLDTYGSIEASNKRCSEILMKRCVRRTLEETRPTCTNRPGNTSACGAYPRRHRYYEHRSGLAYNKDVARHLGVSDDDAVLLAEQMLALRNHQVRWCRQSTPSRYRCLSIWCSTASASTCGKIEGYNRNPKKMNVFTRHGQK